jgi:hypothetical protein
MLFDGDVRVLIQLRFPGWGRTVGVILVGVAEKEERLDAAAPRHAERIVIPKGTG